MVGDMKRTPKVIGTCEITHLPPGKRKPRKTAVNAYSDPSAPLVITGVFSRTATDPNHDDLFTLTHRASGRRVVGFAKLTDARKALTLISKIMDWSKSGEELSEPSVHAELVVKIRDIYRSITGVTI